MPRFTIRRWLAVVAAFALFDQWSFGFLRLIGWTPSLWAPPLLFGFGRFLKLGPHSARSNAILLALALLAGPPLVFFLNRRSFLESYFDASAIGIGLAAANGVGPWYAADRWRRGLPLAPGHWLWAWAGVIWPAQIFTFLPFPRLAWYGVPIMAAAARLLLAGVLLALAFGRRPAGRDWGHLAGWLVVECDTIAWGWMANHHREWIGWP